MFAEIWEVELNLDGDRNRVTRSVEIAPPFGIRCADAEVKAIKAARAEGYPNARAVSSRYISVKDWETRGHD